MWMFLVEQRIEQDFFLLMHAHPPGRGAHRVDHQGIAGVAPGSTTETYAALRLEIENWRWAGVPFYLRTGKRMPERVTEIVVQFRSVPH